MTELALDHDQRNTLVRHLDRVGMPQLMWREPPPNSSSGGRVMQTLIVTQLGLRLGNRLSETLREGAERLAGAALTGLGVVLLAEKVFA